MIKVRTNKKESERIDMLQPYKIEKGKVVKNKEYLKHYGNVKKVKSLGDKQETYMDEAESIKNFKRTAGPKYYF